jgi:hypothetical protein
MRKERLEERREKGKESSWDKKKEERIRAENENGEGR